MNYCASAIIIISLLSHFLSNEIFCFTIPLQPQSIQRQGSNGGFETGISAGVTGTEADKDCFEAAVNGGVAASPEVGADLKFLGVSSGGIRCRQGIGAVAKGGVGPVEASLSGDTSVHFADTKVEANLAKFEVDGSLGGGVVGASFATGAGINIGMDEERRSVGTDITTPVGSFGAHVGCTNEVCLFACVRVKVC